MVEDNITAPANYKGIMVSSTFKGLERHRAALMTALRKEELFAIGMEDDVPTPEGDLISSSLKMVRKGSAYIGLISHRCGQVPECAERNPHGCSITRLEFEEAQRLGLPTLIFVMGDAHPVTKRDIETDPEKIKKLKAYRERAKKGRIYVEFESLEDFTQQAIHAVARLREYLQEQETPTPPEPKEPDSEKPEPIPTPPAFHAEPPYIGSHEFVGRRSQLETLDDWAGPADSHPILLYEAIGGTGKSLLTWEWVTKHATSVRDDWAGRFWYSFYERGAIMADFCRRALAYITGKPLDEFKKKKTAELGEMLLQQLQAKPWLIVFDGLERLLVAYHRYDAAQITDEEAGDAVDQIAQRDPCTAIRPEDDELLRSLSGAAPSKLVFTSRLVPRVLLNPSSQPIPGVRSERLPGLRPPDAEALFRACGVNGNSKDIQNYLQSHCDCNPLVIGVLAGLINDYLPDRGNFDAWAADPDGGDNLNLADLDLVQKRNHVLKVALAALDDKSRQLLSTLAIISEAVDYPTVSAFNPHLSPEPEKIEKPEKPEESWRWERMSDDEKKRAREEYASAIQRWEEYEQALKDRLETPDFLAAQRKLQDTVRDLEQRGLLQYDPQSRRYDLHPVVRGIAAGRLKRKETKRYGQRVVDHFSQEAHRSYEEAETLEDVRDGLHVVRTLLWMGRYQLASKAFMGELSRALLFNLEACAEILSLLRPFFPKGWDTLPDGLNVGLGAHMASNAAMALNCIGESNEALMAIGAAMLSGLQEADRRDIVSRLTNISIYLSGENRLAKVERCLVLSLDLAAQMDDKNALFRARHGRFSQFSSIGQWEDAEAMWQLLNPMGRKWSRASYRPGDAEYNYAYFRFYQGDMTEDQLAYAEQLAKEGKNRIIIRRLHGLRGKWRLEQNQYKLAAESLHEAVRMAREVAHTAEDAETLLALARFHLGQLPDPRQEAERLAKAKNPFHRGLAELWLAIGDHDQAIKHALAAYEWAWADGEPYVHRYELNKTRALLEQLGEKIPDLPPYDPNTYEKFPWEDNVVAAIEKLKTENVSRRAAEKKAKKAKKKTKKVKKKAKKTMKKAKKATKKAKKAKKRDK